MNDSNELMMMDAVERYLRGEMSPEEHAHFEDLRKTNSSIDQLVVEHTLFLSQLDAFGDRQAFRHSLQEVHAELSEQGKIHAEELEGRAKVVYFWNRYKRVTAIAASIAALVAISLSALVNSVAPKVNDPKLEYLSGRVNTIADQQARLDHKINVVDQKTGAQNSAQSMIVPTVNGTGFLIDPKGLMITNAHVVKNSRNIYVQNNKGMQFKAIVLKLDMNRDVAIIKIDDENFKALPSLPYGISRTASPIAESIFTLGYPREEIVYGEGYLSARTGFNGDTLSCQISVDANPGNSGGPVFNKNGEVIGILSAKEVATEGAVFAVQSKYIYQAVDELRQNSIYEKVRLSGKSSLGGMEKVKQVEKIQDCIFMVKGDTFKGE